MKKIVLIFILFLSFDLNAEEICETSSPEIIIDLGGDPEPEKIIYSRDTTCKFSGYYCGTMGCPLDVYDDADADINIYDNEGALYYLTDNDWYIRPSEGSYTEPTKNAFELVIPMSNSYCLEEYENENCARIIKVRNNKLSEKIEVNE